MRVTMSSVWDRASEVIAGRAAILASIAAATIWLPAVIQQAIVGAQAGGDPAARTSGAAGLLAIVVALIGYWGKLAIVAVASDPAVTTSDAYRLAARRLPLLIGLLVIVGLVLVVVAVPIGVALAPIAAQLQQYGPAQVSLALAALPPGRAAFVSLYLLVIALALLWAAVRLIVVSPVVLLERRGVGSLGRSFELTRGHFWRLLGVLLLFGIILFVASIAVQSVVGLIARLILGADHPGAVAFVATLFTAAIAAAASIVSGVFVTRFYLLRAPASVVDPAPFAEV